MSKAKMYGCFKPGKDDRKKAADMWNRRADNGT